MTRRERAIKRTDWLDPDSTRAWLRRDWMAAAIEAYEAELAADLENEETVGRIAEMVWGRFPRQPPYVTEAQTRLVGGALRTLLEER